MKCLKAIVFLFSFCSFYSFTSADQQIHNYIDQYSALAVQEMQRTGVPASITLAQGIVESRYGTSKLSVNSNNHFGIKCNNNWSGGGYYHKDDDYENGKLIKSCFRTYASAAESYIDHSNFLLENSRYHFLFELDQTDYKAWAKGLKKAGYATAKTYAKHLISTIERFELYKYDEKPAEILVYQEWKEEAAPQAELIPQTTTNNPMRAALIQPMINATSAETVVAEAPPASVRIPFNYRAGDGLKKKKRSTRRSFYEDVYGGGSGQYLDEVTPRIASK
jgi:hypothetical protein